MQVIYHKCQLNLTGYLQFLYSFHAARQLYYLFCVTLMYSHKIKAYFRNEIQ